MIKIQRYTLEQIRSGTDDLACLDDPSGFLAPCTAAWRKMLETNPFAQPDDLALVLAISEGRVVGRLGFIASQIILEGKFSPCLWTDGFFLDPEYKKTGAGSLLLLAGLASGRVVVAAGGPDEAAQKLYLASGFVKVASMKRYIWPLRARPFLEKLAGESAAALSGAGDFVLGINRRRLPSPERFRWERVEAPPAQWSEPILEWLGPNAMFRSPELLEWVLQNREVSLWLATDKGKPQGYSLLKTYEYPGGGKSGFPACRVGAILDYACEDQAAFAPPMVGHASAILRSEGAEVFEIHTDRHPLVEVCEELGFRASEGTLAFVRPARGGPPIPEGPWFLTYGAGDMILMKP